MQKRIAKAYTSVRAKYRGMRMTTDSIAIEIASEMNETFTPHFQSEVKRFLDDRDAHTQMILAANKRNNGR